MRRAKIPYFAKEIGLVAVAAALVSAPGCSGGTVSDEPSSEDVVDDNNSSDDPTTPPTAPPAAPNLPTAVAGDALVTVSWATCAGATSYSVKRATTSGGPYTQIATVTTTSYVDAGTANGTPYYYVVSAINSLGESVNSAEASATPQPAFEGQMNLGINLEEITYWMGYAPFVDMAWTLCGNDKIRCLDSDGGTVAVGANGYPTSSGARAVTWAPYPAGDYSMSYDKTGADVSLDEGGCSAGTSLTTPSCTNGHCTATLRATAPSEGQSLALNIPPGISNLHILAPSSLYDPGHVYLRDFLRRMQPFSTIRFMDALQSNGYSIRPGDPALSSPVSNWSERAFPNDFSHARTSGIVYEDIIALANETGKDVWFNVPVFATDDYICRLARLFRFGEPGDKTDASCDPAAPSSAPAGAVSLNASSHLYLEYSNEMWNYGFPQAHDLYCMVNGEHDEDGTCSDTTPRSEFMRQALLNETTWSTGYEKQANAHGVMLYNFSRIFKQVFADRPEQIRVVADAQCAGAEYAAYAILDMINNTYGASALQDIYAVAVAPYLDVLWDEQGHESLPDDLRGIDPASPPANLDLSPIFASMNAAHTTLVHEWVVGNAAEAASYGVRLIAYEGGPGLTANTDDGAFFGAKYLAQRDPRMRQIMLDLFTTWRDHVGADALYTYYQFTSDSGVYGYWGALESTVEHGSMKWDTLMSITRPLGDADLDGLVTDADCRILVANYDRASGLFWEDGDFNRDGAVDAADLVLLNASLDAGTCSP